MPRSQPILLYLNKGLVKSIAGNASVIFTRIYVDAIIIIIIIIITNYQTT